MPRFYFHLDECGDGTLDHEGQDVPDLEAAREVAIIHARSIMKAEIDDGKLCMKCAIKIVDADDNHVMTLQFADAIKLTGIG